jgi:hypothetical protein
VAVDDGPDEQAAARAATPAIRATAGPLPRRRRGRWSERAGEADVVVMTVF